MKRLHILIICLLMLMFLLPYQFVMGQGVSKRIKAGYLRGKIVDSGDQGEGSWGWGEYPCYWDGFTVGIFSTKAIFMGCANFTDTLGATHTIKLSGHGQWETDDRHIMIPVPDDLGYTIHKHTRNNYPGIVVDGMTINDPYPYNESDHVSPAAIPGTADEMVESWINTDMGVSIHQRVFGFSQKNHNKYIIYEWTFKNTGNTDLDDDIELNQTITDWYFLRQDRYYEDFKGSAGIYGIMPGDTLRVEYGYPHRHEGTDYDDTGNPWFDNGYLERPWYNGEAILFASAAVNDMVNDDPNQPSVTGVQDCDLEPATLHSNSHTSGQRQIMWDIMTEGFESYDGTPDKAGSKPGHHSVPFEERGYMYPYEAPWWGWTISGFWSVGPYTLAHGDSVRVVWAQLLGTISPEKSVEVGEAWLEGEASWGDDVIGGATDNLPPSYVEFPELYGDDAYSSEQNNWAKDCWVFSGKDSLFAAAAAAQWAYENDFNVPQPPPPPSIEVKSLSNAIRISWGSESEAAADFAGYRVYRARGQWFLGAIGYYSTAILGGWELIYEGAGGTYSYDDTDAQRGISYYYYVTAYDDGNSNAADYHGKQESLESSMFANMTTQSATLLRPAGTLETVKIVPNPYNISANERQFTGDQDKIMFFGLPEVCTIRIYTESGDLVRTIEHEGSGDEPFGKVALEWQTTEDGQLVVSGIYIAYISTPDGEHVIKKFVVIR